MNELYAALKAIEAHDPDGGRTEPTEQMYAAHKAWAIETYGQQVWDTYRAGGWGYLSGDAHAAEAYDYD